jgi:FdrA protein
MSSESVEARGGAYADSVTLLQVTRRVAAGDGVEAAFVAMGTELNLDLARGMGFDVPAAAGPNDLVIAVRARSPEALEAAQAEVERALAPPPHPEGGAQAEEPPRTSGSALRRAPADLVLVSVPGQYAFAEASDALAAGSDVMIFSDNVPLAQEVVLKRRAVDAGLLVMGPDCGTAVVGGIGLGFANVVERGPVGLVAASGTGAQQLLCLLDHGGVGVSACLGVGGRDLSTEVGAMSTLAALDALDADPATSLIVVVSKPPSPEVADRVRAHAATLATPVRFALLGSAEGGDLTTAAEAVLTDLGRPVPQWPAWAATRSASRAGALRGLYSGGTLCDEAMLLATRALGPIRSNIPLSPELALDASLRAPGHLMIDFGDDELTRGRPHPMIDPSLRLERLAVEAADPDASVVLLDVVLGHGAHPDPAADLASAIAAAEGLHVVVALIGSTGDPQDFAAQAARLHEAGADVFASNAAAARHAIGAVHA